MIPLIATVLTFVLVFRNFGYILVHFDRNNLHFLEWRVFPIVKTFWKKNLKNQEFRKSFLTRFLVFLNDVICIFARKIHLVKLIKAKKLAHFLS